jgi:hypothetical protein
MCSSQIGSAPRPSFACVFPPLDGAATPIEGEVVAAGKEADLTNPKGEGMLETQNKDAQAGEDLGFETVRVLVLGYLTPVLFHEISNVLTVVSGIRQTCFRPGEPPPEKVMARLPSMIDEQVKKSEGLYQTIKQLSPKPQEHASASLFALAEELETLIGLRVRGRRIRVERRTEGEDRVIGGERLHRIKIATLGLVFAALDPGVRSHQPAEVRLRARTQGAAGAELEVEYHVRAAAEAHREDADGNGSGLEPTTLGLCRTILAAEANPQITIGARGGVLRLRIS